MPIEFEAEPGTPKEAREGVVLTAELPLRGHIQMRVVEAGPKRVTFATLAGHPLAGVVQFVTESAPVGARFRVEVFARAASTFDLLAMSTVGGLLQSLNWEMVVNRVAELSGGSAPDGVQTTTDTLEGGEARRIERWIEEMVSRHARKEAEQSLAGKR
jgi:NADH dehydrogenase